MAGLIGLQAADIDVQDALGAVRWKYEGEWVPHPVVRLTTTMPVAVNDAEGRTVVRARWGFPVGGGRPVGNARDDKLLESRMWSSMLGKTPCLVAATAVYEQVKEGKEKVSYWFRRTDGRPIVMPGLVGMRRMKEGEERLCAAIVTTEPNAFFARYHDRQVCTLSGQEADTWMTERDPQALVRSLHAPAEDEWEAVPVDGVFVRGIVNQEDIREVGPAERWDGGRPRSGQMRLG